MISMDSEGGRPTTTFPSRAFDDFTYEDHGSDQPVHAHPENTTIGRSDGVVDTTPNQSVVRHIAQQNHQRTAHPQVSHANELASVNHPEYSGDSSAFVEFSRRDPNEIYQPIYSLGQTEDTIISFHRTKPFTDAVAIRKTAVASKDKTPRIVKQPLHKNIARIMEGFYHEGSRFVVYECMDLSLDDIMAAPIIIHEDHVAAICLEVRLS